MRVIFPYLQGRISTVCETMSKREVQLSQGRFFPNIFLNTKFPLLRYLGILMFTSLCYDF